MQLVCIRDIFIFVFIVLGLQALIDTCFKYSENWSFNFDICKYKYNKE